MPESMLTLWRGASPLKRALLAGVPAVVIALSAAGVIYAGFAGGGGPSPNVQAQAPATTPSPAAPTQTPLPTPKPTEPAVSAGLQASAPAAGAPSGGGQAAPPVQSGSGPGAIQGTGWSLSIPAIGVNASVYSRTVGTDGQMGNPSGAWDVVWYDFAAEGWAGLGGEPGQPGANVVMAGHVDYIRVGPAVFWSIRNLQPGDIVTVSTPNGPINYSIQWSRWADPSEDFTGFVSKTGQESITLVTCIGGFSAGHYSNRLIVRGVRA